MSEFFQGILLVAGALGTTLVLSFTFGVFTDGWPKYWTMKSANAGRARWLEKIRAGEVDWYSACESFKKELGALWVVYYSKTRKTNNYINEFADACPQMQKIERELGNVLHKFMNQALELDQKLANRIPPEQFN